MNILTYAVSNNTILLQVADVRDMEKGLLLLLEDFHNGKLQVFGKGCTFEQMDQVREKQEKLSRLHFDLDAQQQIQSIDNDDAKDLTFRLAQYPITLLIYLLARQSMMVVIVRCSMIIACTQSCPSCGNPSFLQFDELIYQ